MNKKLVKAITVFLLLIMLGGTAVGILAYFM